MNRYDLWLLFTKTGKIEYYLKYKQIKDEEEKLLKDEQKN